jgi:hypothetical protein
VSPLYVPPVGSGAPTVVHGGSLGATETVAMAGESYVHYHGTLDANCAVTITGLTDGDRIDFFFTQDATGSRTVTLDDGGGAVVCSVGSTALSTTKVECTYDGTDLLFEAPGSASIAATLVDAKGDLIAATAADTVARVAVGQNNQYLVADSTQSAGVKWADGAIVLRKTADQTLTQSNTTPQNITGLVIPVLANEVWQFEVILYLIAAGVGVPDWKFAFTVPASTTMVWGSAGFTWADVAVGGTPSAPANESGTKSLGSSGVTHCILLRGLITVSSTAGNVQFQASQNTGDASDSKVLANSHIVARRIVAP